MRRERYDSILEPWLDKPIVLLEIGVKNGGSLLLWHDYFPAGTIVGIDIALPKDFHPPARIHLFQSSQADRPFLSRVANQVAPAGFDIVIDDASHLGALTRIAFWHLFDIHLKPGGLYVIEGWGTGYWEDWPDGRALNLEVLCWSGKTGGSALDEDRRQTGAETSRSEPPVRDGWIRQAARGRARRVRRHEAAVGWQTEKAIEV